MDTYPLVLLANEPGTYRSLLAAELPFLRPNLRVLEVNPAELDAALTRLNPSIVICSRTIKSVRTVEFAVLVLYPDGDDTFILPTDETHSTIANPRLSDILGAIDRAVSPPQTS